MIKRLGIIIALFGTVLTIQAQSECETDYAIFRNEYKLKNYDEALKSWRKVFVNCPLFFCFFNCI